MAAVKKIDKEGLLDAAYELVRKEGLESLSARKLAKEALCSTQPIYDSFHTMDTIIEITKDRMKAAYETLKTEVAEQECADYSKQGAAIVEFARRERVLFRHFVIDDPVECDRLFGSISSAKTLTDENKADEAIVAEINKKMKNYILGMASLASIGYEIDGSEEVINDIQGYFIFLKNNYIK